MFRLPEGYRRLCCNRLFHEMMQNQSLQTQQGRVIRELKIPEK